MSEMERRFSSPDRTELADESIPLSQFKSEPRPSIEPGSGNSATLDSFFELVQALGTPRPKDLEPTAVTLGTSPSADLTEMDLIVGVGMGVVENPEDMTLGPGSPCVELYTSEPLPKQDAIAYTVAAFGLKASAFASGEAQLRVINTGPIDALAHRFRARPAPGGTSVGHAAISAGTFGCLATGRSAPRDNRLLILSNNHVLADVNQGNPGDPILQPGRFDGGKAGSDTIGLLERYVTIDFSQPNILDCATAWVEPAEVLSDLVYVHAGSPIYFSISARPAVARPGLSVGKSGRTTQLTSGRVTATGATIRVNMGDGRVAIFNDQIAVRGFRGDFSAGGDSGSVIWTWDETRAPVGLLFAGGGGTTFANPIAAVLDTLDIDVVV